MHNLRQDGIHFLLGVAMTAAVVGAIVVLGGTLFLVLLALAPLELKQMVRSQVGEALLPTVLFLLAMIQVILWYWLPKIGFIAPRPAQVMQNTMSVLAFFLFMTMLFSL